MKTKLHILSFLFITAVTFAQVEANQVDDFEDATTQNWQIGSAASEELQPMNVVSGGPDGADDNFLQYTSLGVGLQASKMVIFNKGAGSQWTSDYLSEGIVAIKMHVNVSTNDLQLRVAFQGNGTRICTTNPVNVAANSGWNLITIPIAVSDFTAVQGGDPNNIPTVLSNVSEMRILSNPTPAWSTAISPIEATLQIDNITAATTLSTATVALQDDKFTISPNPTSSKLNVFLSKNSDNTSIAVYDVLGKRIFSKSFNALSTSIDVSKWNSGVYLVRVSTDNATTTKRFVKQ